ncbi:MAG: SIS domain-containing protein [Elusimicrobia bacterium]|nr:SIS domain-containing protein [Elusimicrobiota bacterium]
MPKGLKPLIASQLRESSRTLAAAARLTPEIAAAAELLVAAYRRGRKALIFGNGGSAADAQHFAAELVGRFARERRPLPALALTVNTSDLTAIGNDYGYDQVFARQLQAHGRRGDVAVAITTSGSSANVLKAAAAARRRGLAVIGLTGAGGGRLKDLCDVCVRAPSSDTARVQEVHAAVIHAWCSAVESILFPKSPKVH